jgi:hypothetical protein
VSRVLPLFWLAYIVVPRHGWGLLGGRPLTLLPTAVVALVCWLWFTRAAAGVPAVLVGALLAKILLGALLLVPRGFDARYYANPDFQGQVERSAEPSDQSFTRVDDRLTFGVPGASDLPLAFLNDVHRFNFYLPNQPNRNTLPISVVWQGFLRIVAPGQGRFYVRAPGGTAQLLVGHELTLQTTNTEATGGSTFLPGFYRLLVSLSIRPDGVRQIEAGRIVDGREQPFDAATVYRRPAPAVAVAVDSLARWLSRLLDVVLCAWLLVAVVGVLRDVGRRASHRYVPRDAIALVWACAIVNAVMFAAPSVGRTITLGGGHDWLSYESMARDIALNGVAMTQGAAFGHAQPFYYQPLYPYFVALCHWLFGDGLYGVFFVQRLLVAAGAIAMWRATAALFGERIGGAGLAAAVIVFYGKFAAWSAVLISETLFVPLLCMWVYLLVRLAAEPAGQTMPRALGAGLVGGLATLTRSTLVLGWFVALPAIACALRSAGRRWRIVVAVAATLVAVTSLATFRNAVVAHAFVPIASSGPVNLYLGNLPNPPVVIPPEHTAAYQHLGLDPFTQRAIEYARQRPRDVADGLRRKALYTLGWFDPLTSGAGYSLFYIATWVAALLGIVLIRSRTGKTSTFTALMPLLIAMTHFLSVVVIFPHSYGDRQILPFYVLLVPYIAVAFDVVLLSPTLRAAAERGVATVVRSS